MKNYLKKTRSIVAFALAVLVTFTMTPFQTQAAATAVTWTGNATVTEANLNNGTFPATVLTANLAAATDTFKGATNAAYVLNNQYTVSPALPAGVKLAVKKVSNSRVTATFTGPTSVQTALNKKYTITFTAKAFTKNKVATGSARAITFVLKAPYSVAWTVPVALKEAPANDGSVIGTAVATLTGAKFAAGTFTKGNQFTVAGVPSGVNVTAVKTDTRVTFTFTGKATAITPNAPVIKFTDKAFTNYGPALKVTNNQKVLAKIVFTAPGTISGTVKEGTKVLSGVKVELKTVAGVVVPGKTATTTAAGTFNFTGVPVGTGYKVYASKDGYKNATSAAINVTAVNTNAGKVISMTKNPVVAENLTSITAPTAQNVANGTTLAAVKATLTDKVAIVTSTGVTKEATVVWGADTTPTYNAATAGTYALTGKVTLPTGMTNTNSVSLDLSVNIVVAPAVVDAENLVSITAPTAQNVANGTTLATVKTTLTDKVAIVTSTGVTKEATVVWGDDTTPTYNAGTAGTYVLTGKVTLPTGLTNTNTVSLDLSVNVVIAAVAAENLVSITAPVTQNVTNGTTLATVKTTLTDKVAIVTSTGVTKEATVTWAADTTPPYAAGSAGTYTLTGAVTLPTGLENTNNVTMAVTATIVVAAAVENLTSITAPANKNVVFGTTLALAKSDLPETVEIVTSTGVTKTAAVVWGTETTPGYYATIAGTYALKGTVTLPTNVSNTANVSLIVTTNIIIGSATDEEVTSITAPEAITVAAGTTLAAAKAVLTSSVGIITTTAVTKAATVVWAADTTPTYAATAGTFTLAGTVTLPGTVKNTHKIPLSVMATIKVVDKTSAVEISKITVEKLGKITVGDAVTVLAKAQAAVSTGYTVTVKSSSVPTVIGTAGSAIAAGTTNVVFTVTKNGDATDTSDTEALEILVNAPGTIGVIDTVVATSTTSVKVTFKEAVTGATFKFAAGSATPSVVGVSADAANKVFTLTVPTMTADSKYTINITKAAGIAINYEYTYRSLTSLIPAATVVKGNANAVDVINASNVANVTVRATFAGPVPAAGTVTVTLKDSDAKTVTGTANIAMDAAAATITGIDATTLKDGTVTLTASYSDGANVVTSGGIPVTKGVDAKGLTGLVATRVTDATATFSFNTTETLGTYYYLVLNSTATQPTPAVVAAQGTAIAKGTASCANTTGIAITGLTTENTYKLFVIVKDATGNLSNVSETAIANDKAAALQAVSAPTAKTGAYGKFVWTANAANTTGLVGYQALLKSNTTIVADKTITGATLEVDFLTEMRKEAGNYTVEIIALGDGITKSNSVNSAASAIVATSKLATIATPIWDDTNVTLLKWATTEASDTASFTVVLSKGSEVIKTVEGVTSAFKDFATEIAAGGNGVYTATVKAVSNTTGYKIDSAVSASSLAYTKVSAPNDLASLASGLKQNEVKLTYTKMDSSSPVITVQQKTSSSNYATANSTSATTGNVTTVSVTGLSAETAYTFRLMITVGSTTMYSNEVTVTTTPAAIPDNATYAVKAVDSAVSTNEIAIVGSKIKAGSVEYPSSAPNFLKIKTILSQLANGDVITVAGGEITAITTHANNKPTLPAGKTLTLTGNVAADCNITVNGGTAGTYKVIGNIGKGTVTLTGAVTSKFDLSTLATTGVVTGTAGVALTAPTDMKIKSAANSEAITVNNVAVTTTGGISTIKVVNPNKFTLVGLNNAIAIDASAASANTEVEIIDNPQSSTIAIVGGKTTADTIPVKYVFKLTSPSVNSGGAITVNGGNVDVSSERFTCSTITFAAPSTIYGNYALSAGHSLTINNPVTLASGASIDVSDASPITGLGGTHYLIMPAGSNVKSAALGNIVGSDGYFNPTGTGTVEIHAGSANLAGVTGSAVGFKVVGTVTLLKDLQISTGSTVLIPTTSKLTVAPDVTLSVKGGTIVADNQDISLGTGSKLVVDSDTTSTKWYKGSSTGAAQVISGNGGGSAGIFKGGKFTFTNGAIADTYDITISTASTLTTGTPSFVLFPGWNLIVDATLTSSGASLVGAIPAGSTLPVATVTTTARGIVDSANNFFTKDNNTANGSTGVASTTYKWSTTAGAATAGWKAQ